MKTIKDILEGTSIKVNNVDENKSLEEDCKAYSILEPSLLKSDLSFVVSQPGIGKTTLALDIVLEHALNTNESIFVFSPEKRDVEITERLISKVENRTPLYLKEIFPNISIDDFANKQKDAVSYIKNFLEKDCKNCFVFIDFLDCLWTNGRGKKITFEERVTLSDELSEIAKRKNIKLLVSNYITKEEYDLIVCGELPRYLKPVNTILLLDRQPYFVNDEFCTKAELQIISSGNTKTKIELDYHGMLRRFVRR